MCAANTKVEQVFLLWIIKHIIPEHILKKPFSRSCHDGGVENANAKLQEKLVIAQKQYPKMATQRMPDEYIHKEWLQNIASICNPPCVLP